MAKGGSSALQRSNAIRLHTFMFAPLILKIVLKNSLSHKHSNDIFYFNIAPSILKLESILCATPRSEEIHNSSHVYPKILILILWLLWP